MKQTITIELSENEIKEAGIIAQKRQNVHDGVRRRDRKVLASGGVDVHTQGTLGEITIAKATGLEWSGKFFENKDWLQFRKTGHDVGPLEVRATKWRSGSLILHDRDYDNSPFVLVLLHDLPRVTLAGWFWGREGKQQHWWEDKGYGRPCYYVPQKQLKPMSELLEMIQQPA